MRAARREEFVLPEYRQAAQDDRAQPIACGQTISQPAVVAYMTAQLDPRPAHRVLEIGTGSGYQAAVLAGLAGEVFSIERIPELARAAADRLARLGWANVRVRCADGAAGWPEEAPFDSIMVTAAAPGVPPALVAQLKDGGKMILPVGPPDGEQELRLIKRQPDGRLQESRLWPVRFVPLLAGVAEADGSLSDLR